MRTVLIAAALMGLGGAAVAQTGGVTVTAKPAWLSSKPAKVGPIWTPASQWPMCIAGLTPPGDDPAKAAALANYRALYFQKALGPDGLTIEAAKEALAATPKPPAFLVGSCVKEVPSAGDHAFATAHPWAKSYFDGALDKAMFTPVPMTD